MTIEQALNILSEVTKNIQANRETHLAVIQAIKTLQDALVKKEE